MSFCGLRRKHSGASYLREVAAPHPAAPAPLPVRNPRPQPHPSPRPPRPPHSASGSATEQDAPHRLSSRALDPLPGALGRAAASRRSPAGARGRGGGSASEPGRPRVTPSRCSFPDDSLKASCPTCRNLAVLLRKGGTPPHAPKRSPSDLQRAVGTWETTDWRSMLVAPVLGTPGGVPWGLCPVDRPLGRG